MIDSLTARLAADPGNWEVRAQLAEARSQRGETRAAADVIAQAPELPEDRRHLALGSRLLASTYPELAVSYLQTLTARSRADAEVAAPTVVRSMQPPGRPAAEAVIPRPSTPLYEPALPSAGPASEGFAPEAAPAVWHDAGRPVHWTTGDSEPPRRRRFSGRVFTATVILHAILLLLAGIWVVSTIMPREKEKLDFTSERPSASANHKAATHDVKMARRKNMGAAPNARRISTTAASAITIPDTPTTAISDFNPGMMGGGMGSGFGGFGGGAGGGGMGTGAGGGRIKFFGFEGSGNNIILAIDTSGSMVGSCGGPPGIEKLREELNRTINSLSPLSSFNLICFGNQADACFPVNVRATPDNKARAIKFMAGYYGGDDFGRTRTERLMAQNKPLDVESAEIDGVKFTPLSVESVKGLEGTTGGSRMDLAVIAAMERRAETIYVLSDGKPGTSRDGKALEPDDLIDVLRDNYQRIYRNKPLIINTIYTNTDKADEDFMKKLSRRFNGKHKDVNLG